VGMHPGDVEVLGYLPHYFTGTNYFITPVVAAVRPRNLFVPNPAEVAAVFEVPLDLLLRGESYGTYSIMHGSRRHSTWQVQHEGRTIWGITANLTRRLFEMALMEQAAE